MLFPRTLPSIELFADLSSTDLERVLATARIRHVANETRIFNQGDDADRAYVLILGSVRISQSGNDGDQVIIRFIGPGETFGTVALFTDRLYPADADALAEAVIASWSEDELLDLMIRHPQIAVNMIRITGKRLKEVQERVRELSTQRVEQRVACAVIAAGATGWPPHRGWHRDRISSTAQGRRGYFRYHAPHSQPHPDRMGKGWTFDQRKPASDDLQTHGDQQDC